MDLVLYLMMRVCYKIYRSPPFISSLEHEKLKGIFAILIQGVIDVINKHMGE